MISLTFNQFSSNYRAQKEGVAYLFQLTDLLQNEYFQSENVTEILKANKIVDIKDIKKEAMDMIMDYADFILEDDRIDENEYRQFDRLKKLFRINEGDFIRYNKAKIKDLLTKEFRIMFGDNKVDQNEENLNLYLQGIFDLSYDEYENFKTDEVISAILKNADPRALDIANIPNIKK